MSKFRKKVNSSSKESKSSIAFSKLLKDPMVALAFVVLGLVALLLSVLNFIQAVYLY